MQRCKGAAGRDFLRRERIFTRGPKECFYGRLLPLHTYILDCCERLSAGPSEISARVTHFVPGALKAPCPPLPLVTSLVVKNYCIRVTQNINSFFKNKFSSNVCLGGFAGSEPSLSIACCAGPDPTTRSRNSSAMAEFYPNV